MGLIQYNSQGEYCGSHTASYVSYIDVYPRPTVYMNLKGESIMMSKVSIYLAE